MSLWYLCAILVAFTYIRDWIVELGGKPEYNQPGAALGPKWKITKGAVGWLAN
jgi:hypothetical protein